MGDYLTGNYTSTLQNQLKMARDALLAQQSAMNTVSHNVANVNTEGYHRQRATMEARHPVSAQPGMMGTGVDVASIERAYNSFITRQERVETGELGRWESQHDMMSRVEEVMNEVTDYGLQNALNEFWNSWEDLANDADSFSARINVAEKGQDLGRAFHDTYGRMENLRKEINTYLQEDVDTINDLADRIAALNEEIYTVKAKRQNPNDLMDKRDKLILDLSKVANITIQEEENGSVSVFLGNESLIFRNSARHVMWVAEEGPGSGKGGGGFYWEDQPEVEVQLAGGSAYGVQQVRDEIGNILDNLDLLADNIRNEVNELHYTGIGSDGNTGRYFFRHDLSGALSLSVEQTIVDSPEQIAASAVTATGDNSLAHDIFNLQFEKVFRGGTADYNDFYQSIVTDVGAKVANAETKKEGAEAVLEQTKNWQQHYTGVNLDEEMAEMIQVQHAFTAASKVASVIDEMLNRISNGIGA